jgi:hypothetical protein
MAATPSLVLLFVGLTDLSIDGEPADRGSTKSEQPSEKLLPIVKELY